MKRTWADEEMDNIERVDMVKLARSIQSGVLNSIRADIASYIAWGKVSGKDELEVISELFYEFRKILQDVMPGDGGR